MILKNLEENKNYVKKNLLCKNEYFFLEFVANMSFRNFEIIYNFFI